LTQLWVEITQHILECVQLGWVLKMIRAHIPFMGPQNDKSAYTFLWGVF